MLVLNGKAKPAEFLRFSGDGTYLAVSDRYGPIELWDTITAQLKCTFASHTHNDAYDFQFDSTSKKLYAPGNIDGIIIHDVDNGTTTQKRLRGSVAARVVVAPNDSGFLFYNYMGHTRRIVRRDFKRNGQTSLVWSVPVYPPDHSIGWLRGLQYIGDGTRFCTLNYNGATPGGNHLLIRSVENGDILQRTRIRKSDPWGLSVTPDAQKFAVRAGKSLLVWDASAFTDSPLKIISTRTFTGVAIHPNGRHVAGTCGDSVIMFETDSGKQILERKWGIGKLTSICFSEDGMRGAAGSEDGSVVVWDID